MKSKYPTDRDLAAALLALRTKQGMTNPQLAKYFDVGATFISKYLNDNLDHDPKDFDTKAWDVLKSIEARLDLVNNLFETSVSRAFAGRVDMARRTQDVCLICAPAGEGKTSSGRLYAQAHPSTIYRKLNGRQGDASSVESLVFDAIETRTWKGNTSRWDFIVSILKGTSRAIIIDNAHRLDTTGRNWLFDLNEETGCAIVLLGNPEILDKIRANDQQFSRIGVKGEPELDKKELPLVAQKVAEQFSSAAVAEEIADLAAFVASRPGRLRAVRKRVILAEELRAKNPKLDPRAAFRTAHRNLVSDYALPSD
jgi:DNA transposition AAA+ family ATPase